MKKLTLNLIIILLFIFAVLSLLSLGSDYRAERALWRLDHTLYEIVVHKESTPDYAFDRLAEKYRAFIKKNGESIHAKRAHLKLGDLYAIRKDYSQARLEYQKTVGPDKELSAQAELTIARTYEQENRWDKALPVYRGIIKNYPVTNSGFLVEMYLARRLGGSEIQNALSFYQNMAVKYPKSRLEYSALRMIAICQLGQKDYSNAVKTMGEIMLKFPIVQAIKESIAGINLLCITKLHDYDMPVNIYNQFIQKYPDHPADPLLKKLIKDLQLLKNKKLIIQTAPKTASK